MAVKPIVQTPPTYRVVDRRGQNGVPRNWYVGQPNRMVAGASQTNQRSYIPLLDRDTHRNVSNLGRRTLMSLGRWLFWNFPAVSGAIMEQAMFASENFQPQFYGEDRAWGDLAEAWLLEWEKIADVQGWPYDMDNYRNQIVMSELREGDMATLLTENEAGFPMIQTWPAHRIGCTNGENTIEGGPYDGSRICDGVIMNDFRRPIAYRLLDENGNHLTDVPAASMFLSYIPKAPDQVRGFSALASAVFDWQDIKESRAHELTAQKAASTVALLETNETGDIDATEGIIKTAAVNDSDNNPITLATQELAGGTYRYFKAGSNSDLKAFSYDRPGGNVQAYQNDIIRDAFQGMEWSYFFSHDPSKIGGASMRVVVEKINRVARKRQRMLVQTMRRVHGYAIAKAIKLGLLPMSEEWWKWDYQLPAAITADKKYDSDVDVQDYNARFTTLQDSCAKRGRYWEDVQDQWLLEQKRLHERAEELGVDLSTITSSDGSNPRVPTEEPDPEMEDDDAATNAKRD